MIGTLTIGSDFVIGPIGSITIGGTILPGSTAGSTGSTAAFSPSLDFSHSTNSMYIAILGGIT